MIPELSLLDMPAWLSSASNPLGPPPIRDVLKQSVYYPACEFDGAPVKFLGGNFHSFVYVDYGVGRERLEQNLNGFLGYEIALSRDVAEQELTPNGWTPHYPKAADGDYRRRIDWIKTPFCIWTIFQRKPEFDATHGPERFSLLYIGGDGVATFQALYHGNQVAPAVVAVIQPGTGFGGNWTDFENKDGIFARSVLENPSGSPEYLLHGGWGDGSFYAHPCWPVFGGQVCKLHDRLRLWKRK